MVSEKGPSNFLSGIYLACCQNEPFYEKLYKK